MDQDSTIQRLYQDLAVHKFSPPPGMSVQAFHAMGTTVSVIASASKSDAATTLVRDLFAEWECVLSRFRPDSELSRCNRASGQPFPMSALLYTVLTTALTAAQDSQGMYDPAMLMQLEQLGYDRTFADVARQQDGHENHPVPGGAWRQIILDRERRRVTLPVTVKLDFGGIAKGMAVDAALSRLRENGIDTALVNAGGDLAVIGTPPTADAWMIAIPGKATGWSIPLQRGALATSSRARRYWQQGNVEYHHILDPRTGVSASTQMWSVTIVAGTCCQAEVAAKCAFILGKEAGKQWIDQRNLAGLLIDENGLMTPTERWPSNRMPEIHL